MKMGVEFCHKPSGNDLKWQPPLSFLLLPPVHLNSKEKFLI